MFGNGLDLTVSEVVFTKCRGGCGGIHPGWFTCLPGFCLPCRGAGNHATTSLSWWRG